MRTRDRIRPNLAEGGPIDKRDGKWPGRFTFDGTLWRKVSTNRQNKKVGGTDNVFLCSAAGSQALKYIRSEATGNDPVCPY